MPNRRMSEDGIKMLVAFEGEILKVYRDPVGLPTLGVGHLLTAEERKAMPVGTKITRAQSRDYLRRDLKRFEDCVNNSITVPITQNQFDAMVSLAFNIGEAGFKRSSVRRHLNNRKFQRAADAFLAWNKAGGKVIEGLTRRRNTERSVFLTPDDSAAESMPDPSTAGSNTPDTTGKGSSEQPPGSSQAGDPVQPPTIEVSSPEPYQGVGFWAVIKRDLAAATGGNLSLAGLSEYAQQASGWPEWLVGIIVKIAVGALIATAVYFIFRVVHYLADTWKKNQKVKTEVAAANVADSSFTIKWV